MASGEFPWESKGTKPMPTPSQGFTRWWLNNPSEKYARQYWKSSLNRDKNKKYLKPPPSSLLLITP